MRPRKNTVLIMLFALLLTVFAVAMAQTPSQGDQKKSEACCSMETCCCNGGSCPMKEGANDAEAKDAGCCCSGDSCEMKAKDGANHAGCCGDSCQLKKPHTKDHGAGGECCKIKHKDKAKQKTAKSN